jgi:hypothetical protein
MAALIRACLVDGYGNIGLDSLVVASKVATATVTGGNTLGIGSVVSITGATPTELNAEWKITAADSTTFSFAAPGVEDMTASGTIVASIPSAGWEEPYPETNHKACFRALTGDRKFYQIDDNHDATYSGRAILRGFDSMADAEIGAGWEAWCYMGKRAYNDYDDYMPTPGRWIVVTDEKTCYVMLANRYGYCPHAFGEYDSFITETNNSLIVGHLYDYGTRDCMPASSTLSTCGVGMITMGGNNDDSLNFIYTRTDRAGNPTIPGKFGMSPQGKYDSSVIGSSQNAYTRHSNENSPYYHLPEILRKIAFAPFGSTSALDKIPVGFFRGVLHPEFYLYDSATGLYDPEHYRKFDGKDFLLAWNTHGSYYSEASSAYGGLLGFDISGPWEGAS